MNFCLRLIISWSNHTDSQPGANKLSNVNFPLNHPHKLTARYQDLETKIQKLRSCSRTNESRTRKEGNFVQSCIHDSMISEKYWNNDELVHDRTIERTRPSFSVRGRHEISKKNSTGFRSIFIGWDKEKTSLVDSLHLCIRTHTHDSSSLFPSMKPRVKGIETEMNFSVYIYVAYKVEGLNLLWRGIASQPIFGDIYIAAGRDPRTWRFSLLSVPVTKFIRIGIADKNDNPPYFDKGLYEAEVDENEDIQHTVLTVTAKDHDECKWTHMQIREVFFLFSLSAFTESCNRE